MLDFTTWILFFIPSPSTKHDAEVLIAVVLWLVWPILWYSKVVCLFLIEFGQLYSQLLQVSLSYFLIQLQKTALYLKSHVYNIQKMLHTVVHLHVYSQTSEPNIIVLSYNAYILHNRPQYMYMTAYAVYRAQYDNSTFLGRVYTPTGYSVFLVQSSIWARTWLVKELLITKLGCPMAQPRFTRRPSARRITWRPLGSS